MTAPRIEPLAARHDRRAFESGSGPLDRYLREQANQDVRRRLSNCFVLLDDMDAILGYYTLSAASILLEDLPEDARRKLPYYPSLPAALVGRLAVARASQGQGIGSLLILDAIRRAAGVEAAVFALLVDAKDEAATRFYRHLGFRSLASAGGKLFLPMAAAVAMLAGCP